MFSVLQRKVTLKKRERVVSGDPDNDRPMDRYYEHCQVVSGLLHMQYYRTYVQ